MSTGSAPKVSIVIPVYNEEAILRAAVVDLRERLREVSWSYEILIAENGSTDGTVEIAKSLASKYADVRWFSLGQPNYGLAMRKGILDARGEYVVCDEIDLCDVEFHSDAISLLERGDVDLVIGSKLLAGSNDQRPWARNTASRVYNWMLRASLGFRGTDTHGLKALRRDKLLSVVDACVVDKDVFASEFVIRAYRLNVRICEVPIRVVEKRTPSINLVRRVPNVLRQLSKLAWAIHMHDSLGSGRSR
ncbi:MAG: glycosyltransferase family 2 protein [Polyangiaceae bacterium]|nr:glycosyltransferase family 2 protein [Polyangiaceae bacterium]